MHAHRQHASVAPWQGKTADQIILDVERMLKGDQYKITPEVDLQTMITPMNYIPK
jgi:hypothetical protein